MFVVLITKSLNTFSLLVLVFKYVSNQVEFNVYIIGKEMSITEFYR